MVHSPRTIGHFLAISTRSGVHTIYPLMPTTEESNNDSNTTDKTHEVEFEKLTFIDDDYETVDGDD